MIPASMSAVAWECYQNCLHVLPSIAQRPPGSVVIDKQRSGSIARIVFIAYFDAEMGVQCQFQAVGSPLLIAVCEYTCRHISGKQPGVDLTSLCNAICHELYIHTKLRHLVQWVCQSLQAVMAGLQNDRK